MTKEKKEFAMSKILLNTNTECMRITPYMEFSNGTKGCVMLVNYDTDDFFLLLFNSPERIGEDKNSYFGYLNRAEVQHYLTFYIECMNRGDWAYCMSQEAYEKYGVALLGGKYITAYVGDAFCRNLNN